LTSSSFISESKAGGFLYTPMWITRERSVKPPDPNLIGGRGH
jgi:hypothetical protein